MTSHEKDRRKRFKRGYENLRNLIKEFEANLQPPSALADDHYHFFWIRDLGTLTLTKEEAVKYFRCVEELHDSLPNRDHYDLNSFTDVVNEAILKSIDPAEREPEIPFRKRLSGALQELASVLNKPPDCWEVHYTVEGLSLKRLSVVVGKIEFYTANETKMAVLSDRVDRIYMNTPYALDQRKEFAKRVKDDLEEFFSKRTTAKTIVESVTAVAARSQALRELRATLDVLNFFADMLHPRGIAAHAYLPGEARPGGAFSPAFRLDSGVKGYTAIYPSLYRVGPLQNLEISRTRLRKLSKFGFNRIKAILLKKKTERNALEQRILSAFQLAGRATVLDLSNKKYREDTDTRREEAFLLYAISLESLLVKEKNCNSAKFKTRGATLLRVDNPRRKELEKQLSDLYDLRSRIVHDGNIEVSDEDLYRIRFYAKQALITSLLRKKVQKMTSEDEFVRWLDEGRTSSPIV